MKEGSRRAPRHGAETGDRLGVEEVRGALRPGFPWTDPVFLAVTDSTNRVAMEMAESGARHGTVVVADAQTAGRGRMGRRWESPAGKNLYVSLLLRPPVPAVDATRLALVAGVALADAVEAVGVPAALKWPNDLYCGGRKAAGILAEMASDTDGVRHVVIGVGLNVNAEESDFPADLRGAATSLRICAGRAFRRADVLSRLLDAFGVRYAEFLGGGIRRAPRRVGPPGLPPGASGPPPVAGRGGVGNRGRARPGRRPPLPSRRRHGGRLGAQRGDPGLSAMRTGPKGVGSARCSL
jgi:BirA family biotin operon repressor/biotin-[acetyl-CoA-carboxylase] ligase